MFTLDDYEDEILDKLTEFFLENGEDVSDDVIQELAEHIFNLISNLD